ncbi:MAG TPA: metal ABC transporter substrate-binding protein, partial [Thermomicrobiales bacterium]|nr:metal ABC transporter substrate-binding protein [Thermomicrobiales bacterium]
MTLRSRRSLLQVGAAVTVAVALPVPGRTDLATAQDATPAAATPPASSLGWNDELVEGNGKLNVVSTVAPISSIVRNVGGTLNDLRGVVPDGTNSHTFEPAPSDAQILAAADLIVVNGLALEEPTIELAEANLKDGVAIVTLGERTIDPEQWVFDFSFPESDGAPNPHLWTNVPYAMRYAELVAEALSARDPDNAAA